MTTVRALVLRDAAGADTAMVRRDLRAELEADTGEHPPAWHAEVGDILVGTLLRYDHAPDQYRPGESALVAVVQPDDGAPVAIWPGTVLLSLFRAHKPRPGDRLGIKRLADSPPRPGLRSYSRWTMRVDDGGRALDALALAGELAD